MSGKILTPDKWLPTLSMVILLSGLPILAGPAFSAAGPVLSGQATKIIDGDSVVIHQNGRKYEVRLWGVDCPEYDQPYAAAARKLTRRLVSGGPVRVEVKSKDSYGRVVGILYRGNMNVNEELIRQGAAWVYNRYCNEAICADWRKFETAARSKHLGLWKDRAPIAPWKWRRRK